MLRKHRLFSPLVLIGPVSSWNWIQKFKPTKKINEKKKINEYIIDKTAIKAGSELVWL
jgi:hypothetical protein